jgi:hypothetical protein
MPFWKKKSKKGKELGRLIITKTTTVEITYEDRPVEDNTTQTDEFQFERQQVYTPSRGSSWVTITAGHHNPPAEEQGPSKPQSVRIPTGASADIEEEPKPFTLECKAKKALNRVGGLIDPTKTRLSKRPSVPAIKEEVRNPSLGCNTWADDLKDLEELAPPIPSRNPARLTRSLSLVRDSEGPQEQQQKVSLSAFRPF